MKKQKKPVIQVHHVQYASPGTPEWTEIVYKGEHYILSQIQRRKKFSLGFIRALAFEMNRAKHLAVNLDEPSRLKK